MSENLAQPATVGVQQQGRPLSGAQLEALGYLHREGGALRKTWRNAGISATTMASLRERGMVEWFEAPFGGIKYAITKAGIDALGAGWRKCESNAGTKGRP